MEKRRWAFLESPRVALNKIVRSSVKRNKHLTEN